MTGLALLELKLDDHRMHVQHDGETSALLRWWGDHDRDAYFYMQVIDIASFQDCPVVYPASRLLDDGRNFRLNCWELPGVAANELLDKMCSHRDTMKTARAVVRYWVESHPHALADGGLATVLSFPQPGMATMVSKGVWRNFAFPLRARVAANSSLAVCKAHVRVQRAAERAAAAGAAAAAAPPAPADLPPLPDIISRLMLQLRQWSPFINVDQEGENLAELEATLHLLDTLKGLLSYNPESQMKALRAGGARLLRRFDDNRGFQYMGSHLLNCLLLSQFLQSQNALKAAVRHSLQILLPADVGAAVFEHLMSTPQPSSGTISKSKLRIDAAFMLDRRRQVDALVQAGKRPAVYLKTDSSPQAGEDWLLTQYMWIDAAKLMEALQAADHLYFAFYEGAHASLADSKAALQLLWSELKWHSLPPVGIGSGRSGLAHKFRAFLHSLFLECGGGGAMRNLCEFTNSWAIAIVSDRGVESNFLRTRPVRPSDLLAWHGCLWPDGRDARIDAECFGEEEVEIGSQPMIDMRKVLDIPGFAHGLHNTSAHMLQYLSQFDSLKPNINAIAKLLHNRWTRKRFFASCLVGDYEIWRQHFESFPAHLITWRWLSLVTLCKGLAKVEVYVRGAWDRAKYMAHCREAPARGDEDDGSSIDVCDQAIRDNFLWTYVKMILAVADMMLRMHAWGEACSCHRMNEVDSPSKHARRATFWNSTGMVGVGDAQRRCPMSTLRAFEMPGGELFAFLSELHQAKCADILMAAAAACTVEQRCQLTQDFDACKTYIESSLRIILAPWRITPLLLCGAAHPCVDEARHHMLLALQQHNSGGHQRSPHALSCQFLDPRGELYNQSIRFVVGDPLSDLPELSLALGRLRFVSVMETSIEGEHARTAKEIKKAPHVSAPHISLMHRRLHEIAKTMEDDAEFVVSMSADCERLTQPMLVLQELGLQRHPLVAHRLQLSHEGKLVFAKEHASSITTKLVNSIVYNLDLEGQFGMLPSVGLDDSQHQCAGIAEEPPVIEVDDDPLRLLLSHYAAAHFKATASTSAYYGITSSSYTQLHDLFRDMASVVVPAPSDSILQIDAEGKPRFVPSCGVESEFGTEEAARPTCDLEMVQRNTIIFKVVDTRAHRVSTAQSDRPGLISNADVVAMKHDAVAFSRIAGQAQILVTTDGSGSSVWETFPTFFSSVVFTCVHVCV